MTLSQLRYLVAIVDSGLNITAAARTLRASQPGVSRQLRALEEDLGFQLFERSGRALRQLTPAGEEVARRAASILYETYGIRQTLDDLREVKGGTLSIATTHTQARYVLPAVIRSFRTRYPKVRLHIHQGTSEQIAGMVAHHHVDFAFVTGCEDLFPQFLRLPVYRWHHRIIVPRSHPLARAGKLTLGKIAEYPIITYEFSVSARLSLPAKFEIAGLALDVALTAQDADVIKTYVRVGLGVGIIAEQAVESAVDDDLVALGASHLFEAQTSWIGFRKGGLLTGFMREFLGLLVPHLPSKLLQSIDKAKAQDELDRQLRGVATPSAPERTELPQSASAR